MFLDDIYGTDEGRRIRKLDKASCSYNFMYRYWLNSLFERVMRLFIWEGTGELDPKEIEQRLILQGHCGITKIPSTKYKHQDTNSLVAMYGSFFGPTEYIDEFTNYMAHCPLWSGKKTIGKDIVVINNNAIRNRTYELIHHYATLLGHNEVTIIHALINVRDAGGTPIVATEKQKKSVQEYQSKLFNGELGVVTDLGNLGIQYAGADKHTQQEIISLIETRDRLIKAFYSDIGVRSNFDKRNNTVEAEVEADTSLLLLNISDMLKQRQKACKEINKMFGVNWSVRVSDEIDYGTENEQKQQTTPKKKTKKEDK